MKISKRRKAIQRRRSARIRRRIRRRRRAGPPLKKPVMLKQPPAAEKPAAKPSEPPPKEKGERRQVLLCPGPVVTTQAVKNALGGPDLCHREPEFTELMQTVRAKLLHALGLGGRYMAALFSGSGTAALEAAILSCLESRQKLLVINNGVYGSRIAQIARAHEIPFTEIRSPLTERPDLDRVAAALKRDSTLGTVAMVHHETSTGMLNPVEEVGKLTKKFRRRFLVDAISSLGAERLDLPKNNVTFCVGSAGKCLHGAPGLSFVLLTHEEYGRVAKLKPRSLYLDLGITLKAQEAGDPPFTPAVQLVSAFHVALNELIREGLSDRIQAYRERAQLLRSGFKKMNLTFLIPEKMLSNSLTALWLPQGVSYQALHNRLKRGGYVIYAGQSELKEKIFRIAHMGHLLVSDLQGLLKALKEAIGSEQAKQREK